MVEAALAAGQPGREHHPVVGQGGGRDPVFGNGFAERGEHDRAGDPVVGGDSQGEPGVLVEPGQDLAVEPGTSVGVGEPVVGEVGLPALVRHRRFEADVGGLRPLLRLRGDHAPSDQLPGHRGPGHGDVVVVGQVPADGLRAGVQTLIGQFLAEPNDQVHDRQRGRVRVRSRTPGAGLEDGLAVAAVAGEQLIQPRG